jgi:hypothetical protein
VNADELVAEAVESAQEPVRWRASAKTLWRAARAVERTHLDDVRNDRVGASTLLTHERRLMHVIFRRSHRPPPMPVAPVYLMLAGLALEALAKGVLVADGRVEIHGNGGKLEFRWGMSEHLTPQMLTASGIALNASERATIDRLAMFVRWAGRYPAPKLAAELPPAYRPGERTEERGAVWYEDDFTQVRALYERLLDRCDQAIRASIDRRREEHRPGSS